MNIFLKSVLAISVVSVINVSHVNASTTYRVVDRGAADAVDYTFSQQKNNQGESVVTGSHLYNFPVQLQYLDTDDYQDIYQLANDNWENVKNLYPLEDYNGLLNGNLSANDLSWVQVFLKLNEQSTEYQKISSVYAMINLGNTTELLNIFDEKFENSNSYTRSTNDYVNGITDDGWIYGNASAPYLPTLFEESDGDIQPHWTREFTTRGFFSPDKGETIIPLLPPMSLYGGESAVLDISATKIAVGYASTGIDQDALDYIEDTSGGCADEDVLDDIPFDACIAPVKNGMYNTEAFKWFIDATGEVSSEALGHLVTPHEDDERELVSVAQAVNAHGVVAGYSTGWFQNNELTPSSNEASSLYAVVFRNGQIIDLNPDHEEYYDSRAYDISDNGIVVGHVTRQINGVVRTKFYYLDINSDEMIMEFPRDFFTSSSSTARAVNENGIIVGQGEFETHNDNSNNPRRKHGFLYDIDLDFFVDLNDLLTCSSDYTIVEARAINENDEISATATLKVAKKDSKGELMLDKNGSQIYEEILRAVDLIPTEGEIVDCSETIEKVNREGATMSYMSLCLIFLFILRRKKTV